ATGGRIMRKWRWFGLALSLVVILAWGLILGIGRIATQADEPGPKGNEIPGKGQRSQEFIAAFNKGDAKAVAGFWTPDGDYIDQTGHQYKGRAAIEKLFDKLFAEQKGAKLTVTVTSARTVGNEVVLEDGITEVTPADGGPASAARFSAVLLKKDGVWYFESV